MAIENILVLGDTPLDPPLPSFEQLLFDSLKSGCARSPEILQHFTEFVSIETLLSVEPNSQFFARSGEKNVKNSAKQAHP